MRIFQDILYNPVLYRIVQELILFLYRLFHLPGTAFFLMTKAVDARRLIDAVASFVGSYSIGLLITNKVFKEGKYTVKEAAIIATGFSTVSVTCEEVGIKLIVTEESYTSGTSFLDGEAPTKENYNKNRRIKRGLFKSNKGILINADVNGAYQIIKKVSPNAFNKSYGVEAVVLQPSKISVS